MFIIRSAENPKELFIQSEMRFHLWQVGFFRNADIFLEQQLPLESLWTACAIIIHVGRQTQPLRFSNCCQEEWCSLGVRHHIPNLVRLSYFLPASPPPFSGSTYMDVKETKDRSDDSYISISGPHCLVLRHISPSSSAQRPHVARSHCRAQCWMWMTQKLPCVCHVNKPSSITLPLLFLLSISLFFRNNL